MIEKIPGQQVNLRRIKGSDAVSIALHANDITVARNTFIKHPYGLKDAYEFLRSANKNWRKGSAYLFGIENAATGEIIGGLGLEMISRKHRCAEVGYWLSRKFRKRGMTTEAVRLALRFGFKELKLMRIQAHVMDGNAASVRVLERCGFTHEGTERRRIKHRGRWRDLMMFSILRGEPA